MYTSENTFLNAAGNITLITNNINFFEKSEIFDKEDLSKMKERWNARLETGRYVFGRARKPRLF